MAARKKKPTKKKVDNAPKAALRLRGNLKLKYAAAAFELQAAQAKLETAEAEIRRRAETDPVFAEALSLMSHRAQMEADVSKGISKLQTVGRQVCDKLSIELDEFKHYVIDTESGTVTYLPQNTDQEKK